MRRTRVVALVRGRGQEECREIILKPNLTCLGFTCSSTSLNVSCPDTLRQNLPESGGAVYSIVRVLGVVQDRRPRGLYSGRERFRGVEAVREFHGEEGGPYTRCPVVGKGEGGAAVAADGARWDAAGAEGGGGAGFGFFRLGIVAMLGADAAGAEVKGGGTEFCGGGWAEGAGAGAGAGASSGGGADGLSVKSTICSSASASSSTFAPESTSMSSTPTTSPPNLTPPAPPALTCLAGLPPPAPPALSDEARGLLTT